MTDTDPRPASDPLAAEIAAHRPVQMGLPCPDGRLGCAVFHSEHRCQRCHQPWPCLVRRLADEHSRCTNLSNAEAARIFQEATEQRERAEKAEDEAAHYAAEFQRAAIALNWCIDVPRLRRALTPSDPGEDAR